MAIIWGFYPEYLSLGLLTDRPGVPKSEETTNGHLRHKTHHHHGGHHRRYGYYDQNLEINPTRRKQHRWKGLVAASIEWAPAAIAVPFSPRRNKMTALILHYFRGTMASSPIVPQNPNLCPKPPIARVMTYEGSGDNRGVTT